MDLFEPGQYAAEMNPVWTDLVEIYQPKLTLRGRAPTLLRNDGSVAQKILFHPVPRPECGFFSPSLSLPEPIGGTEPGGRTDLLLNSLMTIKTLETNIHSSGRYVAPQSA